MCGPLTEIWHGQEVVGRAGLRSVEKRKEKKNGNYAGVVYQSWALRGFRFREMVKLCQLFF